MRDYALLLAFDSDDASFVRGFEAGRLWARARSDDGEFTEMVGARNCEMVLRIGEATGREVRSEEVGDDWLDVTFGVALMTADEQPEERPEERPE